MTAPCLKHLDADCFRSNPKWAKQAFAYRLVHLLTPKALTKRLPKGLRRALLAPGVMLPPGVEMPDGILVAPGAEIPAGWQPADPIPPGITIAPGTVFPPGWTPGDPVPEGVTLDPGVNFPPGWTPGDPLPAGAFPPPTVPPGVEVSGATPPTYTEPWSPGPVSTAPVGAPISAVATIYSSISDGAIRKRHATWLTCRGSATGDWLLEDEEKLRFGTEAAHDSANNRYIIFRSFYYFDLSSLPAGKTAKAATLRTSPYIDAHSSVSLQQGTQGDPLAKAHYASFGVPLLAPALAWSATGYNTFTLNATGLAYLSGVFGSTAKFCLREFDHDHSDSAPGWGSTYNNSLCYANLSPDRRKPLLTITY